MPVGRISRPIFQGALQCRATAAPSQAGLTACTTAVRDRYPITECSSLAEPTILQHGDRLGERLSIRSQRHHVGARLDGLRKAAAPASPAAEAGAARLARRRI